MRIIRVEAYNPLWKEEFEKAKAAYAQLLKDMDVEIIHVGSTSVEGLWAKPILDIDIVVKTTDESQQVIERLAGVGYEHLGDLGIKGREAFNHPTENTFIKWMDHHLYVCIEGSENLVNHLLLQRHLRNNKEAVDDYSQIKRELAKAHPNDIDAYVDGKTALITSFLEKEGMASDALGRIEDINTLK